MKKLYITRHGETNWNLQGKTQGIKNSVLTKRGLLQAKTLAMKLKNENIQGIYSSDLSRAKSTAAIIGGLLGIPYNDSICLREVNFGKWEGLTNDEIIKKYPIQFQNWRNKPHMFWPPEGENLKKAQERIVLFIKNLIDVSQKDNLLIVSHSTIIKLFLLYIMDMNLSNFYKLKQSNCCINVIGFGNYGPVLIKYNDTCHIKNHS